jgi:hypothetical protein
LSRAPAVRKNYIIFWEDDSTNSNSAEEGSEETAQTITVLINGHEKQQKQWECGKRVMKRNGAACGVEENLVNDITVIC